MSNTPYTQCNSVINVEFIKYYKEGLNDSQIGKIIGLSHTSIRMIRYEFGLPPNSKKKKTTLSKEEQINRLKKQEMTRNNMKNGRDLNGKLLIKFKKEGRLYYDNDTNKYVKNFINKFFELGKKELL